MPAAGQLLASDRFGLLVGDCVGVAVEEDFSARGRGPRYALLAGPRSTPGSDFLNGPHGLLHAAPGRGHLGQPRLSPAGNCARPPDPLGQLLGRGRGTGSGGRGRLRDFLLGHCFPKAGIAAGFLLHFFFCCGEPRAHFDRSWDTSQNVE